MNFSDLGLSEPILDGLRDVGFSSPTTIQKESILPVLAGNDIIASSETGTGKTGAFVIPILEKLSKEPQSGVKCLILTPTRELANQIDEQVTVIGYYSGVTSATVFGGTDGNEFGIQERALRSEGANIIIATPGRLLDHIKMGYVDFSKVSYLVLDEADRMLDMGFLPDVKKIVSNLPENRQNILFSATIPDTLDYFFKAITNNAVRVDCSVAKTAAGVTQIAIKVSEELKEKALLHTLIQHEANSTIVFTRTKRDADSVFKQLSKAGVSAGVIHGDREQNEREITLDGFKKGTIAVLVATDVLARGIDIDDVSHVINYQVPGEPEDYIHRIGRTGRAEAKGTAITFVSPKEYKAFKRIKHHVKTPIEEQFSDVENQAEAIEQLFSQFNEHSKSRKTNRRGQAKVTRIGSGHHHTGETTSDLEASKALLTQPEEVQSELNHDSKSYIRTSTTTGKVAPKEETVEIKKTVRKVVKSETKVEQVPVEKQEAISQSTENKRNKKKRPDRKKRSKSEDKATTIKLSEVEESTKHSKRKPKVLTKRDELQKRFEAVETEPKNFVEKVLRFFSFGKKKG